MVLGRSHSPRCAGWYIGCLAGDPGYRARGLEIVMAFREGRDGGMNSLHPAGENNSLGCPGIILVITPCVRRVSVVRHTDLAGSRLAFWDYHFIIINL